MRRCFFRGSRVSDSTAASDLLQKKWDRVPVKQCASFGGAPCPIRTEAAVSKRRHAAGIFVRSLRTISRKS
jgi:hypothetical protein